MGDRWLVERWGAADGLPVEHISSLDRGPTGHLWLATKGGLFRFDGATAASAGVGGVDGVHSPRVLQVARQPGSDALWVSFVDGRLERRSPAGTTLFDQVGPGEPSMVSDGQTLWLCAGSHELFALEDRPRVAATLDRELHRLEVDRAGGLWNHDGRGGASSRVDVAAGTAVEVPQPGGGGPWAGQWDGDRAREGAVLRRAGELVMEVEGGILDMFEDEDGLWIASGAGLLRVRPQPVEHRAAPDGLGPSVERLWWQDDTETLWARSSGRHWWSVGDPAVRLGHDALAALEAQDGPRAGPEALPLPAGDDELWWAVDGAVWEEDPAAGVLVAQPSSPEFWSPLTSWIDPGGQLWLSTSRGVHRWEDSTWRALPGETGDPLRQALSFVALPSGAVVGGAQGGLVWWDGPQVLGPTAPWPTTVRHLRAAGGWLWLSTEERGFCVVATADLPSRLGQEGAWRCLTESSGLGTYGVHVSLPDTEGRIWVSANRGLGWADAALLDAFARGERAGVSFTWLDAGDGMGSTEANGSLAGAAHPLADGRLAFPTQDGVAIVHPERVRRPAAPAVRFTSVHVDDARSRGPLHEAPPAASVKVSWDSASLGWPDQVHFRHRLDPDDPSDPEAGFGTPSQATSLLLTELAAGDHQLQVQAGVAGVWGPTSTVSIRRTPAWHDRTAPRVLAVLAVLATAGMAVQLRLRAGRRREQELSERVTAATRALHEVGLDLERRNGELAEQARTLDARNATLRDTTERLRALHLASSALAERLQQLDASRRQLFANVSHELRTPIALIVGPLGVLAERLQGEDHETVALALRNSERLHTLVGQVLDLARADSGALQLGVERLAIGSRIEAIVQRFPTLDQSHPLQLDLPQPDPLVWCDPEMLDTIVGNLIGNARSHGAGPIELRVETLDEHDGRPPSVRVSVQDGGPGLPAGGEDLLFRRFAQGPGGVSRGGMGLGLALVQQLVELHGGELSAENAPGGGAVFSFTLPLGVEHLDLDDIARPAARALQPELPALAEGPTEGAQILLVEDNPDLRAFLHTHLSERYPTRAVASAEAGQELLEAESFDLLVSDIMLPGASGLELVAWVRDQPRLAELPVLLISAKGDVGDRVEGLALADDYLAKPFQMRELLARCGALLRRPGRRGLAGPDAPAASAEGPPVVSADAALLARLESETDARMSDADLDLDTLAYAVGLSRRSLHDRLQAMGLPSPGVWLRERRLDRAEVLLDARAFDTVGEVAAAVGLSRSYFSRAFKARTGVSPGTRLGR